MTEEIQLRTQRSGTTVTLFDTDLQADGVVTYKAYVVLDDLGNPFHCQTYDNIPLWRDQDNNFLPVESSGMQYMLGAMRMERLDYVLNPYERGRIANNWSNQMAFLFSGASTSYAFFNDVLIDDMFVNISLHRSFGTLDTLNIYNNLVNSFPTQESGTGTVFGRLVATQKILDQNDNNISIPLKHVPIGVFNPTERYATPISVDENGNRITMNLRESSRASSYFNGQSFSADTTSFLRSGSEFTAVPEHYKYVTTTNEEGEFVLHNVPIGTQTLFFEVDLFKQGLTYDEIALNFFPFPADDEPNIANLPSLFFRQFPIDVIPTWGTIQTGYTETNITVDLDLRKWATYFVEQISFNRLDFKSLQERGFFSPLTIEVRNMAKDGYPINKIQIVEVPDMLSRDNDHVLVWGNEFPQLKSKAQFYTDGYHAFKLPANMYDPVGRKTDKNGEPVGSYGVWLAGYQLSLYYSDQTQLFRNTGSKKYHTSNTSYITRDHFNLNVNNSDISQQNSLAQPLLGAFPYERKWDHVYPEPYGIPALPNRLNPEFDLLNNQGKRWLERPKFLDGDLLGQPFAAFAESTEYGGTGGYGVAFDETNGEWFKTDFSKFVTKNYVYRYENTDDPNSRYSNGYMPNNVGFPVQPGASSVLNGERYQRVECGYAYWLKPEGWPRIAHYVDNGGSEGIYPFDTRNPGQLVTPSMVNGANQPLHAASDHRMSIQFMSTTAGKKLFLDIGSESGMKEGGLDIYRIVDPSPQNLNPYFPSIVPTFTNLYFQRMYFQRGRGAPSRLRMRIDNTGGANGNWFWRSGGFGWDLSMNEMTLHIRNIGVIPVEILGRRLQPGASAPFFASELSDTLTFEGMVLKLEGNANFDYDTFRYRESRYEFIFKNIKLYNGQGSGLAGQSNQKGPTHERAVTNIPLAAGPESSIPIYNLRSRLTNVATECDGVNTVQVNGMAFPNPDQGGGHGDPYYDARFLPSAAAITCFEGLAYRLDSMGD